MRSLQCVGGPKLKPVKCLSLRMSLRNSGCKLCRIYIISSSSMLWKDLEDFLIHKFWCRVWDCISLISSQGGWGWCSRNYPFEIQWCREWLSQGLDIKKDRRYIQNSTTSALNLVNILEYRPKYFLWLSAFYGFWLWFSIYHWYAQKT
jgi:hypothetical protein